MTKFILPGFTALLSFWLLFYCVDSRAQGLSGASNITVTAASGVFQEVSRGPHSRVMQSSRVWTNAAGRTLTNKVSYTELATGMSIVDSNGQYVPASDQIQITSFGAEGTNTQSPTHFAANLNTAGAIDLVMPDGQHLTETPLFLSYFDGTSNALIAELQDTIGTLLPSGNQIIYSNAFSDNVLADVRYDFSLAGLEQDIILTAQLPPPAAFGLGSNVWLQVWSEFTAAPVPSIVPMPENGDQWLDFGTLQMGSGRAFSLGTNGDSVPTTKLWQVMDGERTFLVEQVPLQSIWPQLQNLPPPPPPSSSPGPGTGAIPIRYRPSREQILPKRRLARKSSSPMRVAKAVAAREQGLVIDFVTLNSTQTNYTYQSDTTYFISGSFNSYRTNTFEGGTVLKFGTNGSITITPGGGGSPQIVWRGGAYRPVICTAVDDDTVGSTITNSTGHPTNYYGGLHFTGTSAFTVDGLRVSYAGEALGFIASPADIYDAQFVNCEYGIVGSAGAAILIGNALFANVATNFSLNSAGTAKAENATFSGSAQLALGPGSLDGSGLFLTNCVLANVTNVLSGVFQFTNGNYNGLYQTPTSPIFGATTFTNDSYPFQTVGAGGYYLANDSPFRNIGTSNVDSFLLSNLQQKTTFPPVWFTNAITNDTILAPQASRESAVAPDLGYGYAPIDFLASCMVSNATLMLTNCVALAYYDNVGIWLENNAQLLSQGTPNQHNYIAYYNLVQEQPTILWAGVTASNAVHNSVPVSQYHDNLSQNPSISLRFTTISAMNGASYLIYMMDGTFSFANITLRDSEFYGAGADWSESTAISSPTELFENNLFHRASLDVLSGGQVTTANNLVLATTNADVYFANMGSSTTWTNQNNAFDGGNVYMDGTIGFNAYLNGAIANNGIQPGDIATNMTWAAGALGPYYQPVSSLLINNGSACATNFELYHYTTTTNEVPETNSIVDIGYHYVALGANGLPVSTSGDGIGDYLKDSNGDGIYNTGDLGNWLTNNTAGDGINDYIKYIEGRNLNASNFVYDTTGALGLQVYTPLH